MRLSTVIHIFHDESDRMVNSTALHITFNNLAIKLPQINEGKMYSCVHHYGI